MRSALTLVAALALALASCVTVPTPRSIAGRLDTCLHSRTAFAPHLELACECVTDAQHACLVEGYGRSCAWDGWSDMDRDHITIAACLERQARRTP